MIKELPKHNYRRIMRLLLTAVLTFCMLLMPGCQKQAETKPEEIQDRGGISGRHCRGLSAHVLS